LTSRDIRPAIFLKFVIKTDAKPDTVEKSRNIILPRLFEQSLDVSFQRSRESFS
jgi:hypothetical protein